MLPFGRVVTKLQLLYCENHTLMSRLQHSIIQLNRVVIHSMCSDNENVIGMVEKIALTPTLSWVFHLEVDSLMPLFAALTIPEANVFNFIYHFFFSLSLYTEQLKLIKIIKCQHLWIFFFSKIIIVIIMYCSQWKVTNSYDEMNMNECGILFIESQEQSGSIASSNLIWLCIIVTLIVKMNMRITNNWFKRVFVNGYYSVVKCHNPTPENKIDVFDVLSLIAY